MRDSFQRRGQQSSASSTVTQAVRNDGKNGQRAQQINQLQRQLEHIKDKMKEAESKQAKMIQKIQHHNFKKKNPHTEEYMPGTSPMIHYDNNEPHMLVENQSQKSDQSEYEFQQIRKGSREPKHTVGMKYAHNVSPNFNNSVQYQRVDTLDQKDKSDTCSNLSAKPLPSQHLLNAFNYSASPYVMPQNQMFQVSQFTGMTPYQLPVQFPLYLPNISTSQGGTVYQPQHSQAVLQQIITKERERSAQLQQQLNNKDTELVSMKKLHKKYSMYSASLQAMMERNLDEFMEEVLKRNIHDIEKAVKKNENKLRNLALMLRDKKQENLSAKLINENRKRRSVSRYRKERNGGQASQSPVPQKRESYEQLKGSDKKMNDSSNSRIRSKLAEQRKNKQFEEIASKYEQIIKGKNKQVQNYEIALEVKQKQIAELTMQYSVLEKKMQEIDKGTSSSKSKQVSEETTKYLQRIKELEGELEQKIRQIKTKNKQIEQANQESRKARTEESINSGQGKYKQLPNEDKQKLAKYALLLQQHKVTIEKLRQSETQLKEKQCLNSTISIKLRKMQALITAKEDKITELEMILASSQNQTVGDLLEKSMCVDKNNNEIDLLKESITQFESEIARSTINLQTMSKANEELRRKSSTLQNKIAQLKKTNDALEAQNQSIKQKLKSLDRSRESIGNFKSLEDSDSRFIQQNDLHEEINNLNKKCEEIQRSNKNIKHENLEVTTKNIKLMSEINYLKEALGDREAKYEKLKRDFQESKVTLAQNAAEKEKLHEHQRLTWLNKAKQLEQQLEKFGNEQPSTDGLQDINQLKASRNFSEMSSVMNYKSTYNAINYQNEQLAQRLREAEAKIETQNMMQQKVINQYKGNVDKIRHQLKEKCKLIEQLQDNLSNAQQKIVAMQQQLRVRNKDDDLLIDDDCGYNRKISQLQHQLNEQRQINKRLSDMQQELFHQIAEREQEKNEALRIVSVKNQQIHELEEIIEIKQINISSHITSSNFKSKAKEMMNSQSSLRYSQLSQAQKDRTIDMELSEAGQSFFDQSLISNVSEMFGKEEFPYDRIKLKRKDQARLFEKTAIYIKSLKKAIEDKTKRIRLLERKIDSMRNSELIRKEVYEIKDMKGNNGLEQSFDFKDYYSMQMISRKDNKSSQRGRLEHETNLIIEENNMLLHQIETLQQELEKSEQQQNSLVKIKDLYKDEIKKLIKKNEQQIKMFEEEIKNERKKVEQSEAVHNLETIKQLFGKIVDVLCQLDYEGHKSKKRQERKKELEDYLKVYASIIKNDAIKDKVIANLAR